MSSINEGGHSRREVLKTTGSAVTWGMLATAFGALLPKGVRAADMVEANVLTIVYPSGEGIHWDADYYRDHHMQTIMKLYGASIERFELRKVNAPAGGPAAPFLGAINIWVKDLKAFEDNNAKHGAELVADVPNFTNAQPVIQYDEPHGAMGDPRSDMKVGDTCMTILYPNSDGVKWDVDYYESHHMPLIMRLYGHDAIKRFELRKGAHGQMPDSKAPYIGSVNFYINDQAAFDAAGKEHGPTLVKDVPNFSSVNPMVLNTTIYGVA